MLETSNSKRWHGSFELYLAGPSIKITAFDESQVGEICIKNGALSSLTTCQHPFAFCFKARLFSLFNKKTKVLMIVNKFPKLDI
jgi:hypothetical protein